MFFKKSSIDWIVAGLGNPGKKYDLTRHNVGFEAMDTLARLWNVDIKRSKFDGLTGTGSVQGHKVLLLKPQTFMNLSGKSLLAATEYYKVPSQRVIVLCDDVTLAPGVLRIRDKGSDGGHNGLKSIITFLGQEFVRIRIGVGAKPHPDYDMADWVMGKLSGTEQDLIRSRYEDIEKAVGLLMAGDLAAAMSRYNGEKKS